MHMQLSARTRHLVDALDLALMKPTAFLINTARGELVNEQALLGVLETDGIAVAGLDVYAEEPISLHHPLRRLPNVVLTPHIGFVTEDNYRTYYGGTVDGIRAWLRGTGFVLAGHRLALLPLVVRHVARPNTLSALARRPCRPSYGHV